MIYDNYPESLLALSQMCKDSYAIPQKAFETSNVKRGLRNSDGSGVVAGVTNLGLVHGYVLYEGEKRPDEGKLFYRGYDVEKLVDGYVKENRYGFEECAFLLLFGFSDVRTARHFQQADQFVCFSSRKLHRGRNYARTERKHNEQNAVERPLTLFL